MPVFYPNSGFYISGENLDSVSKVRWGDVDIGREKILIDGTTGISGVMPPNAQTDIVFFVEENEMKLFGNMNQSINLNTCMKH